MRPHRRTTLSSLPLALLALLTLAQLAPPAAAQQPVQGVCTSGPTPSKNDPVTPESRGGIRIEVKGPDGKTPIQRKRFYLLERDVTKDSSFRPGEGVLKRAAYLEKVKATVGDPERGEKLVAWLKAHDCDSLFCPEYEAKYNKAIDDGVPGFKEAYDAGMKKYKNDKLARRWVAVNFPWKGARMDLYNSRKQWLKDAASKGGLVMSVMTDEKGVAYLRDLPLRTYYLSNLIPLEEGSLFWNCEVTVPPPIPRQLYSVSLALTPPKAGAN